MGECVLLLVLWFRCCSFLVVGIMVREDVVVFRFRLVLLFYVVCCSRCSSLGLLLDFCVVLLSIIIG